MNILGGSGEDFNTIDGKIVFTIFVAGVVYYMIHYKPTWEFGIVLLFCFCVGFLSDLIGSAIYDIRHWIWRKITHK